MSKLIEHRGPDGNGQWINPDSSVGFAHQRLSIIDLSEDAAQPLAGLNGTIITYNGEIYNYLEIEGKIFKDWEFRTTSDTETILATYAKYGVDGKSPTWDVCFR